MLDVMAMIGTLGCTSRIMAVAETPSSWGMMISIKIRSNQLGLALTFVTASRPSRYSLLISSGSGNEYLGSEENAGTYSDFDPTVILSKKLGPDP